MTDTGHQRRLLELFDRLLDVDPSAREAWIATRAADEPELAGGLRALLEAHERRSGPIDGSAARLALEEDLAGHLARELEDAYEIGPELGRGGMAIVYRARERKHDRDVVLKAVRPDMLAAFAADRFEREVRIASQMSHPNLVGLIDSGTAGGVPYFVMPWIEAETLRALLDRRGALEPEEARNYLKDIASGLAHAHRLGIVHRDLKPENVLCASGHALVMDFGIARPFGSARADMSLTQTGAAIGTPRYMAPEQQDGRDVDHRADLYALGLIAREVLDDGDSPGWLRVFDRCLAADPDDRPDSADDVVRELEQARSAPLIERFSQRAWPWVAAAVAIVAIGWMAVGGSSEVPGEDAAGSRAPAETAGIAEPIAVAPFRNETSEESYDMLGRLAADWIAQGLQQAEIGPVVPWPTTLDAVRAREDAAPDTLGEALATDLQAGTIVSGSIYRVGEDRLSFRAVITDARTRRIIGSPPPITTSVDSAEVAIQELRDRVLGSLAIGKDPQFAAIPGFAGAPPKFDAYRAYERGAELFDQQEYAEAEAEFERAFALDTTFLIAVVQRLGAANNQGRLAVVDSLLEWLEPRRDRLSEYHDLRRRSFEALRDGDGERALRLELRRAEVGPTPRGSYNAARLANSLNRPSDAVALLVDLDPNGPGLRGWAQYWTQLAHAYHGLGRYDEEYEAAQEMWSRFPERRIATVVAVRALAAAGRHAELDSVLASLRFLPADTYWSLGAAYVVAGEEIRAHTADNEMAAEYLERGVAWLENWRADDPDDVDHRYWLAAARYDLEQFESAAELFRDLYRDLPRRTDYAVGAAVSIASLGRFEEAVESLPSREPFTHGHEYAALARVEAAAGDPDRALVLLQEALRRGISSLPWLHATALPDLGRLHADPRYREIFPYVAPVTPFGAAAGD